jgi:hypothetical protein
VRQAISSHFIEEFGHIEHSLLSTFILLSRSVPVEMPGFGAGRTPPDFI